MAIISSIIVEDIPQRNGQRHICEKHIDHVGVVRFRRYMANDGVDVAVVMALFVPILEGKIKMEEITSAIMAALQDGPAVQPNLQWNTNTEFGLALREFYKTSTQRNACRIGWFVTQFNLTDTQLRNFFGLTVGQVATARAKLKSLSDQYVALLAASGE